MLVALLYLLTGLVAVVIAVGALAGPWWGLLAAGVGLLVLAVLETHGAGAVPAAEGDGS